MSNIAIKHAAESRKIERLFHFTQLGNLESIFNHGIISREELISSEEVHGCSNDHLRLDGHPDAVSCSISYINGSLFQAFKYRTNAYWAVIQLDPSILWEKDCAYCATNAASSRVRRYAVSYLKSERAFNYLFEEQPYGRSRDDLEVAETTDNQAEVLVFDTIDPSYISKIYINKETVLKAFSDKYPQIKFSLFD